MSGRTLPGQGARSGWVLTWTLFLGRTSDARCDHTRACYCHACGAPVRRIGRCETGRGREALSRSPPRSLTRTYSGPLPRIVIHIPYLCYSSQVYHHVSSRTRYAHDRDDEFEPSSTSASHLARLSAVVAASLTAQSLRPLTHSLVLLVIHTRRFAPRTGIRTLLTGAVSLNV